MIGRVMKEVIRYKCEFCKQEFKTPNRHNCKRDPLKKNCYTCQNNKGWYEHEEFIGEGYSSRTLQPECDYSDTDAPYLAMIRYDLQCKYYKQIDEGYSIKTKII